MTGTHRLRRSAWSFAAALVLALVLAAPAWASVASEQQQGAQILSAVHSGTLKGKSLSGAQYEQVGEYLMGQALGSTAAHERMNTLMDEMMGSAATDQMHRYLGERYLGNSAQIPSRYTPFYGMVSMMLGYRGSSIAGMMSGYLNSGSTGAYTNGSGMMGGYGTGTVASSASGGGWPTGAVVTIAVLAALLVAGALTLTLRRVHHAAP